MESLGYLLLDLLLAGELPWSGVTARTSKAGWDRLKEIKEEILLEDLCLGLPHGIMDFIDYTRRLRFNDRPDYDHLRRLLRGCNETGPFSRLVTRHTYSRMIPSPPKYQQQQQQQQQQKHISQQYHHPQQYRQKKNHAREHSNESYKKPSRSVSYKSKSSWSHTNSIGDQQDDVFVMDDLMKELNPISITPSPPLQIHQNYQKKRYDKSNTNQYRNSYRYHSSSSQHQHHYKYSQHAQQKRHQNRHYVGWNSHKYGPQQQQQQQQDQWEGYHQHYHPHQPVKNSLTP
ncbi:hypothetical protein G6F42_017924 [Rhizopus arrhizus]|nr:hypothetical protein G6F42_017924 [Rhizopus arrhizus]